MKPYFEDDYCAIYHGDACAVLAELSASSCDVLLTDPPYASGSASSRMLDPVDKYRGFSHTPDGTHAPAAEYGTFTGDNMDQWSWIRWVAAWSRESYRVVRPGGHAFIFSDWRQLPAATDAAQFGGWIWRGIVVWDKGVARPMKGRFRNHLEYVVWATQGKLEDVVDDYPSSLIYAPTVGTDREHLTQKPVDLLKELMRVVGDKQQTFLDPFMGSGSTLVAAKALGHKAVGIEVEERYCEVAAKRVTQTLSMQERLARQRARRANGAMR